MRDDFERRAGVLQELDGLVAGRRLTIPFLTKGIEQGRYLRDEAEQAWSRQLSAIRQDTERASVAAEKAQREQQVMALLTQDGGPGARLRFHAAIGATGIKESDVQQALDSQWSRNFFGMASEDPEVQRQATESMQALLESSQRIGLFPTGIRKTFNEADIGMPEDFKLVSRMYRQMTADGMADFVRNHINPAAYVKMDLFQRLVERGGLDENEALRRLDALLKDATRRKFDMVAAWSVVRDRLGRSLQDLVGFLSEIQAAGVDLYLHQQTLDTSTPAGRDYTPRNGSSRSVLLTEHAHKRTRSRRVNPYDRCAARAPYANKRSDFDRCAASLGS